MNPTEHELTVATEAIARTVYEHRAAWAPAGAAVATFDQIGPIKRHQLLEDALPFAVAALEALPDRAAAVVQRVQARCCTCHHTDHPHEEWCPAAAIAEELA